MACLLGGVGGGGWGVDGEDGGVQTARRRLER